MRRFYISLGRLQFEWSYGQDLAVINSGHILSQFDGLAFSFLISNLKFFNRKLTSATKENYASSQLIDRLRALSHRRRSAIA